MSERVEPPYLWFNGQIVPWEDATLHATHIIWSGIQTVFEGIRAYWQPATETMHVFRLHEHLVRLKQSMRLVRLACPYDPLVLLEDLSRLLQRNEVREDSYIRLFAFPSERRMASKADEEVINLLLDTAPYPSYLSEDRRQHLMVSSYTRISEMVMPPRVKSISNYRNSDLAMRDARLAGYDGAIMLNRMGEVAEGSWSNLFIVRDGTLFTPDITSDVLEGVTRDTLIALARARLGIPVLERRIARTDLYLADEAFLCGTAAEIQPVASIDRYMLGEGGIGPITHRLRDLYRAVVYGDDTASEPWRTSAVIPIPAPAGSR